MSFKLINVGIADTVVARPPDILRTILGSCIGVCLYDIKSKISGMAHIMLPRMIEKNTNIKKYADTAIPHLIGEMEKAGAYKNSISAKITGGAMMFKIMSKSLTSNIGQSNIDSVKQILRELKISILAEDLGGEHGRTIDFYSDTGMVKIKFSTRDVKVI